MLNVSELSLGCCFLFWTFSGLITSELIIRVSHWFGFLLIIFEMSDNREKWFSLLVRLNLVSSVYLLEIIQLKKFKPLPLVS